MSIRDLVQLITPPDEVQNSGGRVQWRSIEETIETAFPDDYFDLARTYGSGEFLNGTLEVLNPFDTRYGALLDYECAKLRKYKQDFPEEMPYSVHPEVGGLLPFARDDNGNRFLWQTLGDPNAWPIVCKPHGFDACDWQIVHHTLGEFLGLLITSDLKIDKARFWGEPFDNGDFVFVPQRPVADR
mgnify:CR=1 FL=1